MSEEEEVTPIVIHACINCGLIDLEDLCPLCGELTELAQTPESAEQYDAVALALEWVNQQAPEPPAPSLKCSSCGHTLAQHPLGLSCGLEHPNGMRCACGGFKEGKQRKEWK